MSVLYCSITCIIRTLETVIVWQQCPKLRTCFILENVFSTRPLLACIFFFLPLLTSAWCHSRKVEAAEKHPGDGSHGHLPEQNFRELHRWKCKWLAYIVSGLARKYLNPTPVIFQAAFWIWFSLIKDRMSHRLSLSHTYTKCFIMIYGCKGLGSGWRYSEPSLLSYVKGISNICKKLCTPGLFFSWKYTFFICTFY